MANDAAFIALMVCLSRLFSSSTLSISASLRKGSPYCLVSRCDSLFSHVNVARHAKIRDVHLIIKTVLSG